MTDPHPTLGEVATLALLSEPGGPVRGNVVIDMKTERARLVADLPDGRAGDAAIDRLERMFERICGGARPVLHIDLDAFSAHDRLGARARLIAHLRQAGCDAEAAEQLVDAP